MPELLTIGEVAERAHVATSAVRYYERLGLLRPDARQSGQRRYRSETLRRLIFIGMLQDAGLALGDIHGILHATNVADWKAIASRRLDALDAQIAGLQHSRDLLAGALLCRFDHPATECKIMGAEIDRRLEAPQPSLPAGSARPLAPTARASRTARTEGRRPRAARSGQ